MNATTFERDGWAVRITPSLTKGGCVRVAARRGACIITTEIATTEVDTFDPQKEWSHR